jgi:hypothetical protein
MLGERFRAQIDVGVPGGADCAWERLDSDVGAGGGASTMKARRARRQIEPWSRRVRLSLDDDAATPLRKCLDQRIAPRHARGHL